MPNFTRAFPVGEEFLVFRFSLIHRPGGARYWVVVSREGQYVANFYFEKSEWGAWKLSDRYKMAPGWAHALEPLLAEAITSHKAKAIQ